SNPFSKRHEAIRKRNRAWTVVPRPTGHVGIRPRSVSWVLLGSSAGNAEVRPVGLSELIMLSRLRKLVLNIRRRHPMARFAELMHRVKRLARLMADAPRRPRTRRG